MEGAEGPQGQTGAHVRVPEAVACPRWGGFLLVTRGAGSRMCRGWVCSLCTARPKAPFHSIQLQLPVVVWAAVWMEKSRNK